jgi:hypothetical protein
MRACAKRSIGNASGNPDFGVLPRTSGDLRNLGATITHAVQLMHGNSASIKLILSVPIFAGMENLSAQQRYHSLIATRYTIPTA